MPKSPLTKRSLGLQGVVLVDELMNSNIETVEEQGKILHGVARQVDLRKGNNEAY
jgi:hypothetical protein